MQAAKARQADAKAECSKLEKDMDEFKNNKEGKITELKVSLDPTFGSHTLFKVTHILFLFSLFRFSRKYQR